jgi:hypothetical protein
VQLFACEGVGIDAIKLSTVARLNATFPWVTSAALLTTTPDRRVVDAGYYALVYQMSQATGSAPARRSGCGAHGRGSGGQIRRGLSRDPTGSKIDDCPELLEWGELGSTRYGSRKSAARLRSPQRYVDRFGRRTTSCSRPPSGTSTR